MQETPRYSWILYSTPWISEFLQLDSDLCFPNSSHWWEFRFLELYSGFPKEKFLRFLILQQAKISPDSAIRISYIEQLVQIQSIIKKKKKNTQQQQQQQQKQQKNNQFKFCD